MRKSKERKRKSRTEISRDAGQQRKNKTKDTSIRELILKFHQAVAEGPTFVCIFVISCGTNIVFKRLEYCLILKMLALEHASKLLQVMN